MLNVTLDDLIESADIIAIDKTTGDVLKFTDGNEARLPIDMLYAASHRGYDISMYIAANSNVALRFDNVRYNGENYTLDRTYSVDYVTH